MPRRSHPARVVSLCLSLAATVTLAPRPHADPAPGKPAPEMFLAIGQGDLAGVKALLARGADANARNTLEMTALMMAATTGNMEITRTLLAAGAEVNASSLFGSALTFAAFDGHAPVMRLLIEKGASLSPARSDRITVLMYAARTGDPEMVRLLLAKLPSPSGGGVAAADTNGSTALSYAARDGRTEAARLLLAAGAKVDAADQEGWTPLLHAAVNGHAETAALLLEKGASAKLRDRKNRTALLLAASYGDHPDVARVLLKAGAEVEAKDAKGRTALALASARGYAETAKALREGGANPTPPAPSPKAGGGAPGASNAGVMTVRTPRQAAEAGLVRVEHAMKVFSKRTGCISCHHEGIARFATGFAQARGYRIDTSFSKQREQRVLGEIEGTKPLLQRAVADPEQIKNIPIVDVGDYAPEFGAFSLGLAEHRVPTSESLGAGTMVLARIQSPDGAWRFGFQRVPVQSSFFNSTALAVRAMRRYGPKEHTAEIERRVALAKQWLAATPARDTEDRVWRLLGLKWAGATPEERRKSVEELLGAQRPDGGWAQLSAMKSDAYATGSALFALNQGGGLPVNEAAYRRGVQFLLRTQEDDGTWYVAKRAIPANNYFDAEFPYGQSQYISHVAACWATMALILAAEEPGPGKVAAGR